MYLLIFNVFVILLSWPPPVYAQPPLNSAISQLNPCANNCISKFAANIKCGATDFTCQCARPKDIIGSDKTPSPQGGCLVRDCGFSNLTNVRNSFRNICALEAASSAIAGKFTASTSTSNRDPPSSSTALIKTTNITPTPTPTPTHALTPITATTSAIPTFSTVIPTFPPPDISAPGPISSSATQAPAPQTTEAALQAPITSSTALSPIDSGTLVPTTAIADNTSPQSTSTSPAHPAPSPLSSTSQPSIIPIQSASNPFSQVSAPSPRTSTITNTNPAFQNTTSIPPVPQNRLSPGIIAGISFLVVGFVVTLLTFAFVYLRRRSRKRKSEYDAEEKLRPLTSATHDGPPISASRWLPWDGWGKGKNPLQPQQPLNTSSPISPISPSTSIRPQSRGRSNGSEPNPSNVPLSSFPISEDQRSPASSGRPTTSGSTASQPLKSALKKPRERPKSRPLIVSDEEGKGFRFGLDPLGSHPGGER